MGTKYIIPILAIPNVVFYPGTSLPLFILDKLFFEIIEDCIKENRCIGIALAHVDESNFSVSPEQVLGIGKPVYMQKLEDGTLKVLIKGVSKGIIKNKLYNIPYPTYEVEVLENTNLVLIENNINYKKCARLLHDWLAQNIDDQLEREKFIETIEGPQSVIDYLCTFLIKDAPVRQLLLENQNIHEVISILCLLYADDNQTDTRLNFEENAHVSNALKNFQEIEKISKLAN